MSGVATVYAYVTSWNTNKVLFHVLRKEVNHFLSYKKIVFMKTYYDNELKMLKTLCSISAVKVFYYGCCYIKHGVTS